MYKYLVLLLASALLAVTSFAEVSVEEAYYRSYNYEKAADYDDAIKSLLPVYRLYPQGYTLNLRLGWLYYLKGAYTNSIKHYTTAIKTAPNSVEAKLGFSLPLMAQKKWSATEQLLYTVLKIDYYNYYGNLRLSYTLRQQAKNKLAIQVAQKMLVILPTDVALLSELGWTYLSEKEVENATRIFKSVLLLDPENVEAKQYLNR